VKFVENVTQVVPVADSAGDLGPLTIEADATSASRAQEARGQASRGAMSVSQCQS
jgi:hypothetical protein